MPGPYTSFSFGDPKPVLASIQPVGVRARSMTFGLAFSTSATLFPVAAVLQGGVTGTAYSETVTAQGGTSPYTFTITSGALPTGCTMSSGGVVSGTPTAAGIYSFTIQVTDTNGHTGTQSFQVIVAAPSTSVGFGWVS